MNIDLTYALLKYRMEFIPGYGVDIYDKTGDAPIVIFYEDGDVNVFSSRSTISEPEVTELYILLRKRLETQRVRNKTLRRYTALNEIQVIFNYVYKNKH